MDVTVDRVRARYKTAPGSDTGRRLDDLLRHALGAPLERALEAAGIRDDVLVCVDRLHVPVRLDLEGGDAPATAAWTGAVAHALREAVEEGRAVVYPSRAAALADLARRVMAGDPTRRWAWERLGLWPAGPSRLDGREPGVTVARALALEPRLLPAQLDALARVGGGALLRDLVEQLPPATWSVLADGAGEAFGLRSLAAGGTDLDGEGPALGDGGSPAPEPGAPPAGERRHPDLSSAVLDAVRPLAPLPAATARALAVLALLAAAPGTAPAAAQARVAGVAAALSGEGGDPGAAGAARAGTRERAGPTDAPGPRPPEADRSREDAATTEAPETPGREARSEAEGDVDDDGRARGRTRAGGLLYLLHLVGELGLPDELPVTPGLEGLPLRWCLHALALRLAPVAPDDPAALAFCGLPPGSPPPAADGAGDPDPRAAAALEGAAERVRAALVSRVAWKGGPGPSVGDVVARDAVVAADPGWIDVRFSLDALGRDGVREVSLAVRRAGLDLDPGWLPWLGVVVRFAYV